MWNPRFPTCPADTSWKPLIALATSTQGSTRGGQCAPAAPSGDTETRSDRDSKSVPHPALLPVPNLLPHRYCLGSLGDLTISGSPALLINPLRPSSSDSSTPRRATRPLSPDSCPLGGRSGQLQVDFALFLPGMVGVGKDLTAVESSHRPRASILQSAASSLPASHHNFLPVALTAATVTLLSIHHQAGVMGIPLPRANPPPPPPIAAFPPPRARGGGGRRWCCRCRPGGQACTPPPIRSPYANFPYYLPPPSSRR